MEMREFGGTGIRASVVGLGCNNFGLYQNAAQTVAVVHKALDVGINFLDMAGEHGETLPALDELVRQGKVRALGEAATFATADDLNTSQAIAAANGLMSFVTMEANCSIVVRDAERAIIQ
jgi:aryl-alcohol dehydrogenase-like predicted oxidoreductase